MYDFERMDKRLIIFGNIFMLSNRLQTVMDQANNELTAKQWFVMAMLNMFENAPTLKQLATVCDYSHQNTKQLVLKLEEKGFVSIEKDENDLRAMRIVTTDKIKEWDQENEAFSNDFVDKMFEVLSEEEIKMMLEIQTKLYDRLKEMG